MWKPFRKLWISEAAGRNIATSRKISEKLSVGQTTRVSSSFGLVGNRAPSSAEERKTVYVCGLFHCWSQSVQPSFGLICLENLDFFLFWLPGFSQISIFFLAKFWKTSFFFSLHSDKGFVCTAKEFTSPTRNFFVMILSIKYLALNCLPLLVHATLSLSDTWKATK